MLTETLLWKFTNYLKEDSCKFAGWMAAQLLLLGLYTQENVGGVDVCCLSAVILSVSDTNFVLANYKTEPCKRPPRLCRQGYACPSYHNSRDRRRSPNKYKYR